MKYRWTLIGTLSGVVTWFVCFLTRFELFEHFVKTMALFEKWELDEVVFVLVLFLGGLFLDHQRRIERRNRQIEVNQERIRMHKVTMRNVLDIVGNFLHHLQRFTMEAEKTKGLTTESIGSIKKMLFETSDKLQEIAELDKLSENEAADGLTLLDTENKDSRNDIVI